MKKLSVILISLFVSIAAFAQSETRTPGSFSKIDVGGAYDVVLEQGSTESIKVDVQRGDLDDVITEINGSTLDIRTKRGTRNLKATLYITFKNLDELSVSGACDLETKGTINSDDFKLETSGASSIDLAVQSTDFELEVSGASKINLSGKTNDCEVDMSGASKLNALDFEVVDLDVDLSGASDADVHVTGSLSASISGAGDIRYKGSPKLEKMKTSGAATLKSIDY